MRRAFVCLSVLDVGRVAPTTQNLAPSVLFSLRDSRPPPICQSLVEDDHNIERTRYSPLTEHIRRYSNEGQSTLSVDSIDRTGVFR